MRRLVIIGAGGHGRETLDVVDALNAVRPSFEVVGFVATGDPSPEVERRGIPFLGGPDVLAGVPADIDAVIAIGDGAVRRRIDAALLAEGRRSAVLVHPLASVASDNRLGPGVVMAAGARVTTNVTLGRHVHLNVNAVASHDVVVGDYATLSPGVLLNGGTVVGAGAFLGTGAIVVPGCRVGADAVVGAGAVVVDDVAPGVTVVGVPARPARP